MMSECYVTSTAAYLPGTPVGNDQIQTRLGRLDEEEDVRDRVLKANGIVSRHYAQTDDQQPTDDVYGLGCKAAAACLRDAYDRELLRGSRNDNDPCDVTFLASGTTYAPLAAPGVASLLHDRLVQRGYLNHPMEISSHSGVCTSSAAALVHGIRAIQNSEHQAALCVGAEHASEVLKSSKIRPIDDRELHRNPRDSQWYMSVFLRFMLSDGAGAFLLQSRPSPTGVSLRVNWTHSMSFAHTAPLCMKLDNANALLTQDVAVLSKHFFPCAEQFSRNAFEKHGETLDQYQYFLPHMSSFFFRRKMQRLMDKMTAAGRPPVEFWTNLATAGNTGAASIYIMLDQFLRQVSLADGDRILLFIPESGQFNFVFVSLTAVVS